MKEFIVNDGKKSFNLTLPTSLNEITKEYLLDVTADISIAPYYAIVASVYRCKLPEVIANAKKSRQMAMAIVPLFVKANVPDTVEPCLNDVIKSIEASDKIIICGTDIERGYQLSTPKNVITLDTIIRIYTNDTNFAKGVMADQTYYYFVDFKLVSINDIKGYYHSNVEPFSNPFVTINEGAAN